MLTLVPNPYIDALISFNCRKQLSPSAMATTPIRDKGVFNLCVPRLAIVATPFAMAERLNCLKFRYSGG
jgi:hypothetical protein